MRSWKIYCTPEFASFHYFSSITIPLVARKSTKDGFPRRIVHVRMAKKISVELTPTDADSWLIHSIFNTQFITKDRLCPLFINGGSADNLISEAVEIFKHTTQLHHQQFHVWL